MKRWQITVRGQDKGEAYKSKGAWHWYSSTRGTETYGRLCEMRDVQKHVARVCRVPVNEVGFQVLVLTEGQKAVKRRQASSLGGAAAAKARRTATLAAKAGSQKVALRLPAAGNVAQMRTPVTTATLVFKVQKNDVDIGTITFTPAVGILPSGGQAGTISVVQTDFAVGDRLSVQDPAVSDATASDLMVTFAAARLP
jgi:hypothetical protein